MMTSISSDEQANRVEVEHPSELRNGQAFLGRARLFGSQTPTSTSPPTHCDNATEPSKHPTGNGNHGTRNRSKSSSQAADQKKAWAEGIALQAPLLESVAYLRASVEAYDKEADVHEWEKLSRAHQDIVGLKRRTTEASQNLFTKNGKSTAIGNFSSVALEYSKLLDVLMNHCPEYVSLCWGSLKVLLVANINNALLKQKVEQHLVKIGEQLDLVNQLIYSVPTAKMIEAVALLFANFSKFLAKALKYYRKTRLSRALGAFAFPWDTKFQPIVDLIDDELQNIRELAKAAHFRATLQTQQFLHLLRNGQDDIHHDVTKIKEEMQQGLQEMFSNFNAAWIQRFDELQQTISPQQGSFASSCDETSNPMGLTSAVTASKTELDEIQERAFPELLVYSQRELQLRARNRHLTANDYQQSVGLLKDEEMKAWFEADQSKILWVNSWLAGHTDWASAFSLNLIDHAAQLPYITPLLHLCLGHSAAVPILTTANIVQSFVFQTLKRHVAQISSTAAKLALERCESARDSPETLWEIFQDILLQVKAQCIWFVIDAIDMLHSNNGEILLGFLDSLAKQPTWTVKIFVTSRNAGPSKLLSPLSVNGGALSTQSAVITISRARHRTLATLLAKHTRKPGRLADDPDSSNREGAPVNINERKNSPRDAEWCDFEESDSLASFECEDIFASSEDDGSFGVNVQRPSPLVLRRNKESFLDDSDLDLNLEEIRDAQSESVFGISEDSETEDIFGAPSIPCGKDLDEIIADDDHVNIWDSDGSNS